MIEQELGELDGRKLQEWRRQFPPTESEMPAVEGQTPAARDEVLAVKREAPVVDPVPEADSQPDLSQDAATIVEASTTADAPNIEDAQQYPDADPSSVPLPIDEDQDVHTTKSPDIPFEPVVPSEPAAFPPQSSDVLPPVGNAEHLERGTTPTSTKPESATSIVAPTFPPNVSKSEVANDGHENVGSTAGLEGTDREINRMGSDSS